MQGEPAERKRLLRNWVQEVKLKPESLEVDISYRLPGLPSLIGNTIGDGGHRRSRPSTMQASSHTTFILRYERLAVN